MPTENNLQIASFNWNICDLFSEHYEREEYRAALITTTVTGKIAVRKELFRDR